MYKLVVSFAAIAAFGMAQTRVDLRTQSKSVDFGSAASTRPFQTGTVLPATCVVGNVFFNTSAAAGSNVYACVATNTWVVESGGSGGGGNMSTNVQNLMTRGQVITGTQDEVQLDITGNATQTNPVFRVRTSSGLNLIQANNDGSVNIGSGSGPQVTVEQSAPSGTPGSGTEWTWADTAAQFTRGSNSSGATFQMAKEITGLRYGNGAKAADTAATAANVVALFAGCSGTEYLGADGACHSGGGGSVTAGSQIAVAGSTASWNPFDFSTRAGYDDFCGNNATAASGSYVTFTSRMVYSNSSGGTLSSSVTPCGLTMTTAASTNSSESFGPYPFQFTLIPATQPFTLEVVFKTSDATNGTFSFSTGSDNGVGRGSSNGIAIQAVAGGSYITLETCANFSCTSTSSGVAYAANTVYKATMSTNGSGQACIQVNSGSNVCTTSNVTGILSADTGLNFAVKTASATAVTATVMGWAYRIPGF